MLKQYDNIDLEETYVDPMKEKSIDDHDFELSNSQFINTYKKIDDITPFNTIKEESDDNTKSIDRRKESIEDDLDRDYNHDSDNYNDDEDININDD